MAGEASLSRARRRRATPRSRCSLPPSSAGTGTGSSPRRHPRGPGGVNAGSGGTAGSAAVYAKSRSPPYSRPPAKNVANHYSTQADPASPPGSQNPSQEWNALMRDNSCSAASSTYTAHVLSWRLQVASTFFQLQKSARRKRPRFEILLLNLSCNAILMEEFPWQEITKSDKHDGRTQKVSSTWAD